MALLAALLVLEPCGPFRRTPYRPVEGLGRTLVRSWLRAAGLWRASDNSPRFVEGKQGPEGVGRRAEQGVVIAAPLMVVLGSQGPAPRGGGLGQRPQGLCTGVVAACPPPPWICLVTWGQAHPGGQSSVRVDLGLPPWVRMTRRKGRGVLVWVGWRGGG